MTLRKASLFGAVLRVCQVNNTERVQRQFLVQEPDGYLLRLVQVINH